MRHSDRASLVLLFGLALGGCSGDRGTLLEPGNSTGQAVLQMAQPGDKQGNAVDLGAPPIRLQENVRLNSTAAFSSAVTSIPFSPEPGPFANRGPACDDCVQNGLPIGFSFTYFGNAYTTFNLSSNGFIGFGPSTPHGCCAGRTIPLSDGIDNIIAAAWTDLYPAGGGLISYETRGRSPNRFLIINFQDLPWFSEEGTSRVTSQIILYEGSNAIEIHTANQTVGHIYTQGIEDASGAHASFVSGRVASNYGLTNDAIRFTTASPWNTSAGLPAARRAMAVGTAAGLLYVIGGNSSSGAAVKTVYGYNPSNNSWATKAAMPVARQNGDGAATVSGKIYVAGGQDAAGALTRTLYMYNSSTNAWTAKANMPTFGACGGSAVINGKVYVFSGCTRSSTGTQIASGLLHRYDPTTNTWATLRVAPAAHFQPVVAVTGGKLYVVGGNNASGAAFNRLDVYDPATNTWTTKVAMPTPRVGAAGLVAAGKLYVMGGRTGSTYLNTVEAYDPASNTWATRPSMPTARAALGAGVLSNLVYAVGGRNSSAVLTANERFTP